MSEIICLIIMAALKCLEVCDVSGELVKRDIVPRIYGSMRNVLCGMSPGPNFC